MRASSTDLAGGGFAYTPEGEPGVIMAALAIPARPSATTPALHRSSAAAASLRSSCGAAPRSLAAAGAEEIRADCDLGNVAMVKAFERAGYERFARRRSFRIALDG